MATLARLANPIVQDPLPTFAVWSGYGAYGYDIYDSYFGKVAGIGGVDTTSEYWNSYSGYVSTQGTPSSNGGTYQVQGCSSCYSEGSSVLNLSKNGGYSGSLVRNGSSLASTWTYFGTVIGEPGIRQKISLYCVNNDIAIHSRGDSVANEYISTNSSTYRDTTGAYASSNGMVSYNDRTRTLCHLIADASGNYKAHFWKNPNRSINSSNFTSGDLHVFMSEAKAGTNGASYYYNTFTWTTLNATSYATEALYHMRVIMGDNGVVGLVRFTPSNQTIHGYFTSNTTSGSSVSVSSVAFLSNTTSYGMEQGSMYGMRSVNSWDNNWISCHAPYYYYHSGINAHYVYTPDPSKGYVYQDSSTTYGRAVAPLQEDKFILSSSINADGGSLLYAGTIDPNGALVTGYNASGSAITNGGTLVWTPGTGFHDTNYTSTNYTTLVPMSSWVGGSR